MNYHIETKISKILQQDDADLQLMFESPGQEVRKQLEEKCANGDILIGVKECVGFSPITGCPGHE